MVLPRNGPSATIISLFLLFKIILVHTRKSQRPSVITPGLGESLEFVVDLHLLWHLPGSKSLHTHAYSWSSRANSMKLVHLSIPINILGILRTYSFSVNLKHKSRNLKQGKGEGEVAPIVSYQNQLRSLEERASVRGGGLAPYRVA